MTRSWKKYRETDHIEKPIQGARTVEIADSTRAITQETVPTAKAYGGQGAQFYADILSISVLLDATSAEGETRHKRPLRFLDLHFRAVDRMTSLVGARHFEVDRNGAAPINRSPCAWSLSA